MNGAGRPTLLVLASTYPRWQGDHEPGFVHELSKRLVSRFRVVVICPAAPGARHREYMDGVEVRRFRYAPDRWQTLVNDGGITANLRKARWKYLLLPGFLLSMLISTMGALLQARPMVVHAHWLIPQGFVARAALALVRRKSHFVVTSHGADLYGWRGRAFRWIKRLVLARADIVTVVSRAMVAEVTGLLGGREKEVVVVPMGVDLTSRFTPARDVDRDENELLFVGRLVEKKGLRHLIDAMPTILRERPAAKLTIVGFGPELGDREAQAATLGVANNVDFVGAIPQQEIRGFYHRATLFVAPFVMDRSGDQEGLGLVMVEAAGCGCRVIASDLPAVRDVAQAVSVRLVAPGSPAAIAASVLEALRGSQPGITEDELRRLRECFDWNSVARRYSEILAGAPRSHEAAG